MSGHIVVVGSLNMDLVIRVPQHPKLGETLLGGSFGTFPGGKGANQAVAAARLGGTVCMVGRVGVNAFGDTLIRTLAQDNVNTTNIVRDQRAPTGVALITVDAADQNTIVVAAGANAQLSPEDINAAEAVFAVALAEGRSIHEAARWGNAAGALAVTRAGAQPSLPRRAELEALLTRS